MVAQGALTQGQAIVEIAEPVAEAKVQDQPDGQGQRHAQEGVLQPARQADREQDTDQEEGIADIIASYWLRRKVLY